MKLLRELLEDFSGMTTSSSVAGYRMPIGKKRSVKKVKMMRRPLSVFSTFSEMLHESDFNAKEVIAKLSNSQNTHDRFNNTTIFGLEDVNGHVIKVYVRSDEAKDFEAAVNKILAEQGDNRDIAELIYELKGLFDIRYVEWPNEAFHEDEEETVDPDTIANDKESKDRPENTPGDLENIDMPKGEEPMPTEETPVGGDEEGVKSLLDKVIQMLKVDAEARQADANARAKEAEAREAEWAARTAEAKIKSTEEITKMEDHFRKQKDEKKEAETISKLARYRHEINQDDWENR